MPSILRDRLALVALFATMLIPVGVSNLRGLTHVITCDEQVETPFALVVEPDEDPTVISATTIERGAEGAAAEEEAVPAEGGGRLCGGLSVDLSARTLGPERVQMVVPITNHTRFPWQGTVLFEVGSTPIPIEIGEIPPGETGRDTVTFSLGPGDHEISGSLLIGP